MSVHKKLMEARIRLQNTKLQKTGHNKFAGYTYFELGDFLPTVQQIFSDLGLCGCITFLPSVTEDETGIKGDIAILRVTDIDDDKSIDFSCPMAMASLKGCHEVQNLGASMTYIRRYLWVNALEIVEHDVLDATTGKDAPQSSKTLTKDAWDSLSIDKQKELQAIADTVRSLLDEDLALAIGCLHDVTDVEEKTAIWSRFDSKERAKIKAYKPLKENT